MSTGIAFVKGHGTQNDFVLLPDLADELDLDAERVAAICHRRSGIGADGVLRVVPTTGAAADEAEFFMDYRNADGSIAEMCGNGLRVFARYLVEHGHQAPGDFAVATRAGVRRVTVPPGQGSGPLPDVTVDLGQFAVVPTDDLTVSVGAGTRWSATNVDMGNPHAVAFVADLGDAGDLCDVPEVSPASAYPNGVNVEFVVDRGPRHVAMRVHERGSGETQSCGTGAGAVAVAAALRAGDAVPSGTWRVDVPGGTLQVHLDPDGAVRLTGPAELVAEGTFTGW